MIEAVSGREALGLRHLPLDPARLWARYLPRRWPAAASPWVDLASGGLGQVGRRDASIEDPEQAVALGDVLYLPPVAPQDRQARDQLAAQARRGGTPVLVQIRLGDEAPADSIPVVDLLESLIGEPVESRPKPPPGAICLWPLIPGVTDLPGLVRDGIARLQGAGATAVHALEVRLTPQERRRLAEQADEDTFRALFHGRAANERRLATVVAAAGLEALPERPLPDGPGALRTNRRLAGVLARCGDLWRRLGRPEPEASALLRAARWVDHTATEVRAMAREGNLGVLPGLDDWTRGLIQEWADGERLGLLAELREEYLHPSTQEAES